MPRDHPARTIDQEFGEIPFDRGAEQSGFLVSKILIERMGIGAIDVDLLEHRKTDCVIALAKLLDFGSAARLLPTELVAGKTEHRKPPRRIGLLQRLQTLILRGETAGARGVDDQKDLTLKALQRDVLAFERPGPEVVD